MHPFYAPWASLPEQQCPRSLELFERIISLPLHPGLSDQDVNRVVTAVKQVIASNLNQSHASGAAA